MEVQGSKNNTLKIVLLGLIIIFFLTMYTCKDRIDTIKSKDNLIEALEDSLQTWKDKDNLNHAKIQILQTENTKTFLSLKTKDKEVLNLQNQVEKYKSKLKENGSSVTNISTDTDISIIVPTEVDTTKSKEFPTYTANINLQNWVIGKTVASIDSTKIDLKVKNKYSVIIGEESPGLFKKKIPYVEVENENPYSETKSLRAYQVTKKNKKFSVGPSISYGIGTNFIFQPFIGISLQYTLIKF